MSGHNLESELYPSSTGIIPTQTQAASLALTDILHALTCEWLPGEIVCGSCEWHCMYWGIQYWQLGKWCLYLGAMFRCLQPCGVTIENYLLHLCICVVPLGKCFSSTKVEFEVKNVYWFVGLFLFGYREAIVPWGLPVSRNLQISRTFKLGYIPPYILS